MVATFVMIHVGMYTKCWTFENISCFESLFLKEFGVLKVFFVLKVFVLKVFVLKMTKQLRTSLPTQNSFVHFLLSFDISILPLIGKKPYLWM